MLGNAVYICVSSRCLVDSTFDDRCCCIVIDKNRCMGL